ncbi:MAG: hypothetical protein R3200_09215, partial [Xanthomonadales bacterium]|nr:hypothetical protein [Xanthomonadales bacterium]
MLSILATLLAVSGGATGSDVEVFPAVTPSIIDQNLAEVTPLPPWRPGDPVKLVPRRHIFDPLLEANPPKPVNPVAGGDPLIDETWLPDWRAKALGTPALNLGPTDGAIDFVGGFPPDTVGDVGQDYYIQSTNGSQGATYVIFNKSDGSVAAPAFSMSNLPGATPACRDSGAGDPIVLYDELAGRWLLTEFTSEGPNRLCVYVSRTGDPISGGWFSYDFQAPSFPDYPKYGVWPDAYYVGTNEGVPAVYALERTKMLLGQAARMMRSAATGLSGFGFQVLQPADVDGTTRPPAGAPGLFLRHRDDEVHNPGSNDPGNDFLEIFEFDVDFEAGTGSLNGPTQIAIADIDSDLCGLQSFECFQQPNTTQTLDPLREPVMRRVQYRNFGDYETLVGNLTTDVDTFDRGGIRFFELRRTGGGQAPWELFQEGTLAPDGDSRWMGSAAMDSSGNIAIGYSVSSSSTFPSLRYTGRLSTDANGALTAGETTIIDGSQSQTAAERWGDYSALSVDPADGCTFWFTSEYVENDNQLWSTRIASFKFDECGSANFTLMGTNLSQEVCTAPGSVDLQNVTLTAGAIGDFNSAIQLDFSALPSGFTGDIQPTSIMPGGSGTASISASGTAPAGNSEIVIRGTSGSLEQTVTVNVLVTANAPGQVVLSSPADGAADVLFQPTFSWSAAAGADQYRFQLASDAGFGTLIEDRTVN